MDAIQVISVISAILGILSFVFAIWVWLRSDIKVRELTGVAQSAYDMSGQIIWEMQTHDAEDVDSRLRQAERCIGLVSGIRTLTEKYSATAASLRQTELGTLLERGVIWTTAMIDGLETSEGIREIWLVTPDLEPDTTDTSVGAMVNRNLRKGRRYIFFHPDVLSNSQEKSKKLLANVGAISKKLMSQVVIVPISSAEHPTLFHRGNTILYFKGAPEISHPSVFEEIVLTKISQRGLFWQECDPSVAEGIYYSLSSVLRNRAGE